MEYIILVLALITIVATIVAAASMAASKIASATIKDLKTKLEEAAKEKVKMEADLADAVSRRETIITDLKKNLADAEADLAKASTPAAVRERLSKLFP